MQIFCIVENRSAVGPRNKCLYVQLASLFITSDSKSVTSICCPKRGDLMEGEESKRERDESSNLFPIIDTYNIFQHGSFSEWSSATGEKNPHPLPMLKLEVGKGICREYVQPMSLNYNNWTRKTRGWNKTMDYVQITYTVWRHNFCLDL